MLRLTCAYQVYPEQIITYTVTRSEPCFNQLLAGRESALSRCDSLCVAVTVTVWMWMAVAVAVAAAVAVVVHEG